MNNKDKQIESKNISASSHSKKSSQSECNIVQSAKNESLINDIVENDDGVDFDEEIGNRKLKKKYIFVISIAVAALLILLAIVLVLCFTLRSKTNSDNNIKIESVSIQQNGVNINSPIDVAFYEDNIMLNVEVNNGRTSETDSVKITWSIINANPLGCTIDNNGKFTVGNTLGSVVVEVKVESKNTVTVHQIVNIVVPSNLALFDLNATVIKDELNFIEGQHFSPEGIIVCATFINSKNDTFSVFVNDYLYDADSVLLPTMSDTTITYTYNHISRHCLVPIIVRPKTLQKIEIVSSPNILKYIEGQYFDSAGLKILAHYEFFVSEITDFVCQNIGEALAPDDKFVEIYYTDNGVTKTAIQAIDVSRRTLQSINIVHMPTKLNYIQGQFFRKDGLKVEAVYEYMTRDVTDEVAVDLTDRLFATNFEVNFSYTEGGIEKSEKCAINVEKPYQDVRVIKFTNPYDVSLSWLFEYMGDDGIVRVDDTSVENYDSLMVDNEKGVYIVPVGAVVTILKVSPAVIGLKINEKSVGINYPSNSYEFEVDFGIEDIEIDFIKLLGSRITLRFTGEKTGQNFAFIYPYNYEGNLYERDVFQLAQIFEETEDSYYTFDYGGIEYTFDELTSVVFSADALLIAIKHERVLNNSILANVKYPNVTIITYLDRDTAKSLNVLPKVNRIGYRLEFSTTQDGVFLNDTTFTEWLGQAEEGATLFARYTLVATPITGNIIGVYSYENEEEQISLTLIFNADGTYSYSLYKNDENNCIFAGVYKDNLSVEYLPVQLLKQN